MSYQVLARKWRPRSFDEVAGQEHVLRALINALDNDRLHHAYLFTGTRGVGKTTLARILAKCLNCEQGVSSKACNECSACTEINEGRFIDLIEVDAASRTKVEDTRELLDNVQYLPTRGRYKVYLIDEVHMLSTHSFNALLKTLEEPPPHVKFLLATTDPKKLPVTVLSRCLQFNLKNLSPERIVEYLKKVLGEENVPCEEAALWSLARAADGSMRDALSLTDQAISHGDGKLIEAELSAMLGTIDRSTVLGICRMVAERNAPAVLKLVEALAEQAPDYSGALAEILSIWHRVAVVQAVPGALDNSLGDQEEIRELAEQVSREDVQLFYQICLLGRRDLPLAMDLRSGLEMVLLRQLAFQPVLDERVDPPELAVTQGGIEAVKKPELVPPVAEGDALPEVLLEAEVFAEQQVDSPTPQMADTASLESVAVVSLESVSGPVVAEPLNRPSNDPPSNEKVRDQGVPNEQEPGDAGSILTAQRWLEICYELPIGGRLLNVASNLEFIGCTDGQFQFRLDRDQSALYDESHQQGLAVALGNYLGGGVSEDTHLTGNASVVITVAPVSAETPQLYRLRKQAERQARAVQTLRDDPLVKELEQRFGGKLLEDTVIPLD